MSDIRKKTNEEFIEEVYELVGDEYVFLEEYENANTKIKCRHSVCEHEWDTTPANLLNGRRCPICSKNNKGKRQPKSNEVFIKKIYELVDEEYIFLEKYKGSHTKILCRHNKCGREWKITPNYFINNPKCPKCTVNNNKKTNKEFIDEVNCLVGNEYIFLENYINSTTKIKCRHNLESCKYEWDIMPNNFLIGQRCPKCAGSHRRSNEEFAKEVYELVGNEYIFLDEFINTQIKIKCRHNKKDCNYEWEIAPSNFLSGIRCPKCFGNSKKTNEAFIKETYDLVGDKYEFLEEYKGAHVKIMCKHNECNHEWKITPGKFLQGRRCPQCNESKGEERVRGYLEKQNVKCVPQYSFNDCRNKLPLPFDFYLPNYNLLIEYDGIQHYEPTDFIGQGNKLTSEQFENQQHNDNIKNQYCKENNIPLLRIPYWEFDNIEDILFEKLNELKVGDEQWGQIS